MACDHLGVSAGDQRALTLLRGGPLSAGELAKRIDVLRAQTRRLTERGK